MRRSTIRGQKEKQKEKQQQKEKAFNPSIENNQEVEGQSHIQKTIDVKVVVVPFWNVQP
ncbi:hypothetical protein [Metabacillus sediminilitoris]|uniref:hypothetical protein n=1 Tax=Metabacillus sediminilitoris TaxID=2567941 RepID=UPI0012D7FB29|nr:hypothetical protein [Metabacillus sediminilitoris]QGQ46306.1 hypothetical protein GMB29_14430 [Metabacillus sediminilitoris]